MDRKKSTFPADKCKKICAVYGEYTVKSATCRKWFQCLRENNYNVEDAVRSGRPIVADDDEILAMIQRDRYLTTREVGAILNLDDQKTVSNRLRALGMDSKCDVWVPHELTEKN